MYYLVVGAVDMWITLLETGENVCDIWDVVGLVYPQSVVGVRAANPTVALTFITW